MPRPSASPYYCGILNRTCYALGNLDIEAGCIKLENGQSLRQKHTTCFHPPPELGIPAEPQQSRT